MNQNVREAVTEYLKKNDWARPKEIIEAIYPEFKNKISEDTLKREVFRSLKNNPKIIRNFHSPHYAYKRPKSRFTNYEIEFMKKFFEMVENPIKLFAKKPKEIRDHQYPNIPLERTYGFKKLRYILSRLWKDPRDIVILKATDSSEKLNELSKFTKKGD